MVRGVRRMAAFTLIEMVIVVALVALIITLAAPSLRDMILMQRLRAVNAQIVTDLTMARSEAVSRNAFVQVRFQSTAGATGMSCYMIFTRPDGAITDPCDCTAAEGARCAGTTNTEVKTVQLPRSEAISLEVSAGLSSYTLDPRTGGIVPPFVVGAGQPVADTAVEAFIDTERKFRNVVSRSGRVSVCAPFGSRVGGVSC